MMVVVQPGPHAARQATRTPIAVTDAEGPWWRVVNPVRLIAPPVPSIALLPQPMSHRVPQGPARPRCSGTGRPCPRNRPGQVRAAVAEGVIPFPVGCDVVGREAGDP